METAQEEKKMEAKKGDDSINRHQLIVFRQGAEEYAMFIDQIKEVVITPNITKMPQTAPYIKGVANIRGNIIAIVNLEEKFDLERTLPPDLNSSKNFTLVVESEEFKIGLLVKEVPDTITVVDSDINDNLSVVQEGSVDKNYIQGIVKLDQRLVILIDIFKVMSKNEVNQALNQA